MTLSLNDTNRLDPIGSLDHATDVLASELGVPVRSQCAFRGRVKNLRRLGLIAEASLGKGRKGPVSHEQLLRLCIGAQLTLAGFAPEHAARIVADNEDTILECYQNPLILTAKSVFIEGELCVSLMVPLAVMHSANKERIATDYRRFQSTTAAAK